MTAPSDYHRGTIVEAARGLLAYAEKYGSLRLIAEYAGAYDFDEFMRALRWIASREAPCRGCRIGGGWSWWLDCPVRDCIIEKGLDFYHQCGDFPCERLRENLLLAHRNRIIEANEKIMEMEIENWKEEIRKKYRDLD